MDIVHTALAVTSRRLPQTPRRPDPTRVHSEPVSVSCVHSLCLLQDLMELRAELQEQLLAQEELEEMLRRRERELTALKGALKEEVASHDQEVDKLKEQNQKEISRLQASLEEAQQVGLSLLRLRSPPHPSPPPSPPPPLLHTLRGGGDKAGGRRLFVSIQSSVVPEALK